MTKGKVLLFSFLILYFTLPDQTYREVNLESVWKRIYIDGVGIIDIPPTMEVQSETYKRKTSGYLFDDDNRIIIQQKGLNDFVDSAFNRYARVIINTIYGKPGDFLTLYFDINSLSQAEIEELNTLLYQQSVQSLKLINHKMIKWYPLRIEKVNGMSCFHVKYIRQMSDNPYVMVNMYLFHNYDRAHILTLSYRVSEADYWEKDFKRILSSFRITNIRP